MTRWLLCTDCDDRFRTPRPGGRCPMCGSGRLMAEGTFKPAQFVGSNIRPIPYDDGTMAQNIMRVISQMRPQEMK